MDTENQASSKETAAHQEPTQAADTAPVTLADVCPPSGGVLATTAEKQTPHKNLPGQPGNTVGGRPAGKPNSFTTQFRRDVALAYATKGGYKWLMRQKPALFAKILMHVVPRQVQVDKRVTNRVELAGDIAPMLAARVDALIAQLSPSLPSQEPAIDVEARPALPEPAPEQPSASAADAPPIVL